MLTSLFGDLSPPDDPRRTGERADAGFAATAILESVATEVNARGQMVDRHSHDLVVTGSPAQAIREHFANTRSDLDTATSLLTLVDPAGVWASAVIKALSDAGGRPIERLHLREHATLRTLATIERTTLVRRHEDTLRIYHADVRVPGPENAEIPVALMERSQMTTVIVGPLQPHAIDALLAALHAAAMLPTWRCPNLLFMLPPNAVWIANKIRAVAWPARLHVHLLSESMTGASSVWNAMLGMWNQIRARSGWAAGDAAPSSIEGERFPLHLADPEPALSAPTDVRQEAFDPNRAKLALAGLLALEGLLGCAIVDTVTGQVLARESLAEPALDMLAVAAGATELLRAHREAAATTALAEPIDEIATNAGARLQVIRAVAHQPALMLVALFERAQSNLTLARFQFAEAERLLG